MTLAEQLACCGRELALRRNVYPKLIASKRMSKVKADHEIDAMAAVIETLKAVRDNTP